ncbi:unnamed protein product [Acanthosepion pharaonis]|uniref:G-protein coupled receptors family 1 profile domain-containing protein n=1 Tax=Acanthosepion pharaonis TaxID=158019 RepID=A0A812BSU5_ACAPH|nr:unnamed protein product [Sepia pharaonis]
MDQFPEFIAYKQFLQRNNFSMLIQSTPYNFTGAQDILEEFTGTFYSFNNFQDVVLVTLYVPIFITALVGNVLIMVSVLNDVTWRKAKNVFLFNLSVADLSVALICMPMAVGTLVYRLWIYGEFLCKFTAFMQVMSLSLSFPLFMCRVPSGLFKTSLSISFSRIVPCSFRLYLLYHFSRFYSITFAIFFSVFLSNFLPSCFLSLFFSLLYSTLSPLSSSILQNKPAISLSFYAFYIFLSLSLSLSLSLPFPYLLLTPQSYDHFSFSSLFLFSFYFPSLPFFLFSFPQFYFNKIDHPSIYLSISLTEGITSSFLIFLTLVKLVVWGILASAIRYLQRKAFSPMGLRRASAVQCKEPKR